MQKKSKFVKLLIVLAAGSLLTSCNTIVNYPNNASSAVLDVTGIDAATQEAITDNQYSDIYKSIISNQGPYAQCLDNILYKMATDTYLTGDYAIANSEFKSRYEKTMVDAAISGSYSTDNKFDEYRYALSLISSMYAIKTSTGSTNISDIKAAVSAPFVINPDNYAQTGTETSDEALDREWNNIFKLDYTDYINRNFKPTIYRQYLTARHIYDQSYSSIGNTNARNITAVKITDRSDKPGVALKLINGFISKYINDKTQTVDLHNLARLWKGIDISADEKTWLSNLGVSTLKDQIDEDVAKITTSEFTTNSTLESSYTGSYTYTVDHGKELAYDTLKTKDLITSGTFLKSTGVTSLTDAIKTRVFQTDYSTNTAGVEAGTVKDNSFITTHTVEGEDIMYRFVTPASSMAGTTDNIVHYDSSSSSYYIVMMNSIVTTSRIAKNTADTTAVAKAKFDLAMDAAYEMSSQDSYKKNAIIWYLTNNTISYSDPYFYAYIDKNYPSVFD